MKAVIQRVIRSSVSVEDEVISSIGRGLCVFIGISRDDTKKDMEFIARKILSLRLFEDATGRKWGAGAKDRRLEVLCVSQFTLCSALKGNKLDFHDAMPSDRSQQFYDEFLALLRSNYEADLVKDGKFGAYMEVNIVNDGPVTVEIESPRRNKPADQQED
ncbi:D-aminoacyl-tRNA deacylase 1 [Bacillus rossius redtenbacheri]|uniref:D-aminoacyl-tRNA deacylase 1 n=1 Tax=Bacillus rossius redtenbacheri TaxID=93214 RepID=UPI002FDCD2C9